ncbi:hypothetical protein CVT25_003645 [Psilocybe cyanescens]|uniref:REJ domain-containing protein n=1 Tax=Psilocybe cyanescens TaxID=93625 RepID=A0A409WPD9_PSICY|nr:hypothetical protein CVT25_003645 [Psilocybe cyanescens]
METSIFDLARSKGAVSALLYSVFSQACIINPEYSDSATFNHVFDVFAAQTSATSHLVVFQFDQLSGDRKLSDYDSQMLNDSAADITLSIKEGSPVANGFLLASLSAFNSTDAAGTGVITPSLSSSSSSLPSSTLSSSSPSPSTTSGTSLSARLSSGALSLVLTT